LLEIKVNEEARGDDLAVRTLCRSASNIALLDYAEGLWWSIMYDGQALAKGYAEDPGYQAVVLERKRRELKTIQQEMLKRHHLLRDERLRYPKEFARASTRLSGWRDQIHREVDLADVIAGLGAAIKRGKTQAHTSCPRCGGTDRFVVWPPPRSRGWCRQCGLSLDVIGFLMEFWRCEFVDAVQRIAHDYLHVGPTDEKELV
jgi:hypothetical protein